MALAKSYVDRLFDALERRIKDALDAEEFDREMNWRAIQSGACAMAGAIYMDERRDARKKAL